MRPVIDLQAATGTVTRTRLAVLAALTAAAVGYDVGALQANPAACATGLWVRTRAECKVAGRQLHSSKQLTVLNLSLGAELMIDSLYGCWVSDRQCATGTGFVRVHASFEAVILIALGEETVPAPSARPRGA